MVETGKNVGRTYSLSFLVYGPNLVASMGTGVDRMSGQAASGKRLPRVMLYQVTKLTQKLTDSPGSAL